MPKNVFFLCFFQKIFKKICVCQKKVVPLHSLLKKQDFFCQLKFVIESVAQQVEHIPFKDGVLGSSPSWFTRREFRLSFFYFYVLIFFFFNQFACKVTTFFWNMQETAQKSIPKVLFFLWHEVCSTLFAYINLRNYEKVI